MISPYNTLSEKKEPLPDQKKIRLFVCGPTVYDYAHIGHARTYIFFDFFAKYLKHEGYDVFYLQNITDIDDKIIKRAAEESRDALALARSFTDAYFEDMEALGVWNVKKYAPATQFISQIVAQVERLIEKDFAYKIDDDGWYFDVTKFPDYGKLSHRTALQAEDAVSRIDESIGKRNKGDFCLWKFSKPGEPSWNTAVGNGRPGWHIEDTAISEYYFGPQYEIHGGGVDLKFPHHEAEIAQQEAASGKKPFVRIWMHTGALLVEGKKMSKSLNNFITIRDFLAEHKPETLRFIALNHHYRSPIDYSEKSVEQAEASLDTLAQFFAKLEIAEKGNKNGKIKDINVVLADDKRQFFENLANDVNTPQAIAGIFETVGRYQDPVWNLEKSAAKALRKHLRDLLDLLGFTFASPKIPPEIHDLAEKREEFRTSKQFIQADGLRKEINSLGYEIEDTPRGPFLWPRNS